MDIVFRLLPIFVTILIALIGFYVWHRQMVARRKFEVAEKTIEVVARTMDALSRIRHVFIQRKEILAIKVAQDAGPPAALEVAKRVAAILQRVENEQSIFGELRTAQIVAAVHFSDDVVEALQTLLDARRDIILAAQSYSFAAQSYLQEVAVDQKQIYAKRMRDAEDVLHEIRLGKEQEPADGDKLSARLDISVKAINELCRTYLRDPTFWEFVVYRRRD